MSSRLVSLIVALLASAQALWAQDTIEPSPFDVPNVLQVAPTILTVDIDRLFSLSQFGQRVAEDYSAARAELATENRRIAEALREEELALTAERAEMDPDVFRTEAEAFDEKAQGIRRAQDAKESALEDALSAGRTQFLEAASPILGQLMVERGAFAILDRRSVLLSLGSIEITDDAVERINAALGDGGAPELEPETAPETIPGETPEATPAPSPED